MAPFSVTLRCSGRKSMTGCAVFSSNSVELAPFEAGHVAGELDDRDLHAEADAEVRDVVLAGEAGRRDLALGAARAEAGRHQDAVGPVELGRPRPCFSISSESMWRRFTLHPLAMPPWTIASLRLLYDSTRSTYLPTSAMSTSPVGLLDPVDDLLPAGQLGRARPDVEQLGDLVVDALLVEADRHLVDARDVLGARRPRRGPRW